MGNICQDVSTTSFSGKRKIVRRYQLKNLVRKPAPQFQAEAWYKGEFKTIKLSDYKNKYLLLVFYPLNFTFVCPTQLIAFDKMKKQFNDIGCQILACSIDSKYSHMEYTLKSRQEGGLGQISIPLLSDINKTIALNYGCLCHQDEQVSYRATYIIDKQGIVKHCSINDLSVGRNPQEYLRLVKAFQYTDKHGQVCPANWQPGNKTMIPDALKNNYKQVIDNFS